MVGNFDQLEFELVRLEGVEGTLNAERLVQNFTVLPDQPYTANFPYDEETKLFGDGIYRVCAVGYALNGTVTNMPVIKYSYVPFAVSETDTFSQLIVDGVVVYDASLHGVADMSNPPTSYANMVARVQLAGGVTIYIPPGDTTIVPWLPAQPYDQLLFVFPSGAGSLTFIKSSGSQSKVTDCVHFVQDQELPGTGDTYISGFIVNGQNVLPRSNYLMPNEEYLFIADLQNWVDANGGGTVNPVGANQFMVLTNACWLDDAILQATVGEREQVKECEYIIELCDAYVCYTRLLRELLCKPDPCCEECEDKKRRKEIMEDLRLMNLYFMGGLMPLVNRDRLWYFGNMNADELRTTQITELNNVYLAFSRLSALCGNGCKPKKDCGC